MNRGDATTDTDRGEEDKVMAEEEAQQEKHRGKTEVNGGGGVRGEGGWGGGTVNKIHYAKCRGAHPSRGNNAGVRVSSTAALCAFLPLTDN